MKKTTELSRIDRAIADNIPDIEINFKENSGIVQDFIIFILKQVQFDLFGFTTFTLADFCKATGRTRVSLSYIDKRFNNTQIDPPEVGGYKFETVFDYALYDMMQKNLIFTKAYTTVRGDKEIKLEAIRIISDLRITYDAQNKKRKIYNVNISPELLEGFVRRYYNIDFIAYKALGKGRNGDQRKRFMIYLSKIRHILWSQKTTSTILTVDELAKAAGIKTNEDKHRKQSVKRLLDTVNEKTDFNVIYKFITAKSRYAYYIQLTFPYSPHAVKEDHIFFADLIDSLSEFYKTKEEKVENFQEWLTNHYVDMPAKAHHLKRCYYKRYRIELSDKEAINVIKTGLTFYLENSIQNP